MNNDATDRQKIEALLDQYVAGMPLHNPLDAAGGAAKDGETITLTGTAVNTASGAAVVDGGTTLVGGLTEWPSEAFGKRVSVTGKLVRTKVAPDPVVGPNGEQSHGAWGSSTILVDVQWEVAS